MTELSNTLLAKAKQVRLLALDVDGVLTDGRLYFTADGETIKTFSTLDGHGLKMLRQSGVELAVITGRSSAMVEKRIGDLGIKHLYMNREDKLAALKELLTTLQLELSQVAYMGDDLPDLPAIHQVGLGLTVPNAYSLVKEQADWCSDARGGEGAVREACDLIMQAQGTLAAALSPYLAEAH